MLTREEVYKIIDREREYQDRSYAPLEKLSSGLARNMRDLDVAPGILMIEGYTEKARKAWIDTQVDNLPALKQVAKIAAIAVRILERAGGTSELLKTGLR